MPLLLCGRLQEGLIGRIRLQQFGFQQDKCTQDAIHLIRRMQDLYADNKSHPLYFAFLDWEKAFDRVSPAALSLALKRIGTPPQLIDAINSLYLNPLFRIQDYNLTERSMNYSPDFRLSSGIRQGCPLSPFFVCDSHDCSYA